jgi:tRNA(Ile2) C34 agmatinyltransferase TiaS
MNGVQGLDFPHPVPYIISLEINRSRGAATRMKKVSSNVCRDCGREFRGRTGSYRCPECRKKEARYKEMREKMRRSLPFYLKTDS